MNLQFFQTYNCSENLKSHCNFKFYLNCAEILSKILEMLMMVVAIYGTVKSPFHFNLVCIGIFLMLGSYLFFIGRIITCLYDIGIFEYYSAKSPPYFLLIGTFFQYYYMGCVCSINWAFAFERYIATINVDSYEIIKKKWVSKFLCSEIAIVCNCCAVIMILDLIPFYIMSIIGLISCVSCFLFYNILFWMNKKWLEKIVKSSQCSNDKYTLSLRFQLNENLQAMTLLRNIAILTGLANVFIGAILITYNMTKNHPHHQILSIYLQIIFIVMSSQYTFSTLLVCLLSVKTYRRYFLSLKFISFFLYPIFGKCFEQEFGNNRVKCLTKKAEADAYFVSLQTYWNP